MKVEYQGIIERAPDGTYWAFVTEFPGATGSGDTPEQARDSLSEAMRVWVADAIEAGEPIPKPSTVGSAPVAIDAA